jgi:hypothetical protein
MYLQGSLQAVFDALYHLGVIDPVLEMDWQKALSEMPEYETNVSEILMVANNCKDDVDQMMLELQKFDQRTLGYLAMEVAREFADFHARQDLH